MTEWRSLSQNESFVPNRIAYIIFQNVVWHFVSTVSNIIDIRLHFVLRSRIKYHFVTNSRCLNLRECKMLVIDFGLGFFWSFVSHKGSHGLIHISFTRGMVYQSPYKGLSVYIMYSLPMYYYERWLNNFFFCVLSISIQSQFFFCRPN